MAEDLVAALVPIKLEPPRIMSGEHRDEVCVYRASLIGGDVYINTTMHALENLGYKIERSKTMGNRVPMPPAYITAKIKSGRIEICPA